MKTNEILSASIKRKDIKECPRDATHVRLTTDGLVQMFYKVSGENVQYLTFCGLWHNSTSSWRDTEFINKLVKIK